MAASSKPEYSSTLPVREEGEIWIVEEDYEGTVPFELRC